MALSFSCSPCIPWRVQIQVMYESSCISKVGNKACTKDLTNKPYLVSTYSALYSVENMNVGRVYEWDEF